MANSSDIAKVLDAIESDYAEKGWDEGEIVSRLDDGAVPERIIAAYWRMRASKTILLVNTSESGSSRGNDAIYARMKTLAEEWDAIAKGIESPTADARGRLGSFPIKRV